MSDSDTENVYSISFRIGDEGDSDDRYDDLTNLIEDEIEGLWWADTTSFYVKRTDLSITTFTRRLGEVINHKYDLVLVLDAYVKRGRVIGNPPKEELFDLLPYVKRITKS